MKQKKYDYGNRHGNTQSAEDKDYVVYGHEALPAC